MKFIHFELFPHQKQQQQQQQHPRKQTNQKKSITFSLILQIMATISISIKFFEFRY
jgi:hypothetical protein